ncbi:hypothetical protein B0T11DRAFT_71770 [Plectosphaerella cucumerina]|uniref:Uncharacterized protein n=1 Tax=Plectosphaerella cucumerina TaxID=40658 RepID=A0A8K0X8P7_9PEZI|nr:hypothetical protein B0T11DRAFT_71770 [Plectosphaerella cucumerina]
MNLSGDRCSSTRIIQGLLVRQLCILILVMPYDHPLPEPHPVQPPTGRSPFPFPCSTPPDSQIFLCDRRNGGTTGQVRGRNGLCVSFVQRRGQSRPLRCGVWVMNARSLLLGEEGEEVETGPQQKAKRPPFSCKRLVRRGRATERLVGEMRFARPPARLSASCDQPEFALAPRGSREGGWPVLPWAPSAGMLTEAMEGGSVRRFTSPASAPASSPPPPTASALVPHSPPPPPTSHGPPVSSHLPTSCLVASCLASPSPRRHGSIHSHPLADRPPSRPRTRTPLQTLTHDV